MHFKVQLHTYIIIMTICVLLLAFGFVNLSESWLLSAHTAMLYIRGAQTFWAKGCSVLFLVHSRAEDKNYALNF